MGLKMVLLWQWRVALVLTREKEKLVAITVESRTLDFIFSPPTNFQCVNVDITVFNFNL